MKKFTFDFDLDLWIRNLEIIADDKEKAKEEFLKMSVEDLIEEGYVKDYTIKDLDIEEGEEW